MLLPRLLTAVIGIPLIILTVYWGGVPFFIIMLGVVFLSLREYFILADDAGYESQPVIGLILGLLLFLSVFLNGTGFGPLAANQGTPALLSLILIPLFARELIRSQAQKAIERMAVTFFGAFFIAWAFGHLVLIRAIRPSGMQYVYFLFFVIWSLDTAAYAVGVKYGSRRLAEMVSPKKTIEGAIAGIVCGILVAVLCRFIFLGKELTVAEAALAGLFIAVVSQFSDLAESLLKRDAGVKDSARLLPGHGGMLDRFDSFLFTAPLFYYYLTLIRAQ